MINFVKDIKENHYTNKNIPLVMVERKANTLEDSNNALDDKAKFTNDVGFCKAFSLTEFKKENVKETLKYLVDKIIEINEVKNTDSKGKEEKECSCCSIL